MSASYRQRAAAQQEHRDEQRQAKLEALHARLHQEVQAFRSGADWQRWLQVAGRFHHYSFRNTLLILAQRPDATAVAGYEAWKAMGRQVNKGERGIQILAPVLRRARLEQHEGEPQEVANAPGQLRSDEAGEEKPAPQLSGFRLAYVWDVAQTTGEPLPASPSPALLSGQAPDGLWDALASVVGECGFRVERDDCGSANGLTDFEQRTIRVRPDVDDAQAVKTLAHEVGHLVMHDPAGFAGTTADCRGLPRCARGRGGERRLPRRRIAWHGHQRLHLPLRRDLGRQRQQHRARGPRARHRAASHGRSCQRPRRPDTHCGRPPCVSARRAQHRRSRTSPGCLSGSRSCLQDTDATRS